MDSILIMFWRGEFDIDPMIHAWQDDDSRQSTLHFKDLYIHGFHPRHEFRLSGSFADEALGKKLRSWAESPDVKPLFKQRIEKLLMGGVTLDDRTWVELDALHSQL